MRLALVAVVTGLVIGGFVWIAAGHYARGVEALEAKSYGKAVSELSAARVLLIFPYRDGRSLEQQARRALEDEEYARYEQAEARRAAVLARLEGAGAWLGAGDADAVLATLQAIDADDLQAALDRDGTARESADTLADDLAAASRRALRDAAWGRAGRFAAALLVLEPSSGLALSLGARARTGEALSAKLRHAKDAARRGEWRVARRLALAVLAVQKDFPGAAAVVADARRALAPKPKPAVTRPAPAATTPSPTQPAGGSASATPPQPPPP